MKYKKVIVRRSINFIIRNVLLNKSYLEVEAYNYGTTVSKLKNNYDLYYEYWDELYEISKKNRKFHPNYDPVSYTIKYDDRIQMMKDRVPSKPNLGKKFSEETKLKMSLASKGKKKSEEHRSKLGVHKRKPVVILDQNGNIINEWVSVKDTLKNIELPANRVINCLRKNLCNGIKFKSNL